jgi:hypothetical protein
VDHLQESGKLLLGFPIQGFWVFIIAFKSFAGWMESISEKFGE